MKFNHESDKLIEAIPGLDISVVKDFFEEILTRDQSLSEMVEMLWDHRETIEAHVAVLLVIKRIAEEKDD